jgi:predicted AlkP superfamily pyrophosphatase or phosphodiesterase
MAQPTAVLLVVGLNRGLLEAASRLKAFADKETVRTVTPDLPAVTCSVQSSMLTGLAPSGHGIVGNGWYNREAAEVQFWKQSNHLVQGEKVWEAAKQRDASVTVANLFWWFNMYSSADYSVTPRPMYKADGRKIPDCYSEPPGLRDHLQEQLGPFPLFQFWGPGSSIASSRWITQAARFVFEQHRPTLNLVYLPHLDYALQKLGPADPGIPAAVREIDDVAADLIDFYEAQGVQVMIVSEYGIEEVTAAVRINRVLREADALRIREEQGRELLDPGASRAFAVADHQVAHVYMKEHSDIERYHDLCSDIPGVEQVLDRAAQTRMGIGHSRAGDLLLVAESGRWFSYDYWLDDARAPDFARTVDIHRKPGYDPVELFLDPAITLPKLTLGWKLLKRRMGFRTLLDVIPLDPGLVKGSHGRVEQPRDRRPVLITKTETSSGQKDVSAAGVRDVILEYLFGA